jgi:RsiW-degrading membrane proteinase PrsW (M82 family)
MILLLAVTLGFAPGLLWLAFFLKEDVHPEPRKMIVRAFIIGGLSAFVAYIIEFFASGFLKGHSITLSGIYSGNLTPFLGFALVEEVIKFAFIWRLVRKNPYFDEPIDAMIYMITGALGFATAENFFLVLSSGTGGAFAVIFLRFIGATLLHALSSAVVGYAWAWGFKKQSAALYCFIGLIFGSLFHAIFNILVYQFNTLLIYPTAFLMVIGFLVLYDFEKLRKFEIDHERRGLKGY